MYLKLIVNIYNIFVSLTKVQMKTILLYISKKNMF